MSYSNVEAKIDIEYSNCHKYFNPSISNDDLDKKIIKVKCNHYCNIMEVKSQDIKKSIEKKKQAKYKISLIN